MTSIFVRITDIISANVNHLMDKVEDPERMIKQIILEMEDHIRRAENSIIDAIASEKELARELYHHRAKAKAWREKAEIALNAGNENLARAALDHKKEHEGIANDLEESWEAALETSKKLKRQLRELENKLAETRRKRSAMVARKRSAEAVQHIKKIQVNFRKGLETQDKFFRMEDKILQIEAQTDAITELYDESSDLEREIDELARKKEVEDELAWLKKEMKDKHFKE